MATKQMAQPVTDLAGRPDDRPRLTPSDVVDILGIDLGTVYKLMDSGRIRAVNVGTGKRVHRRTSRAWLDAYLEAERRAAGA